MQPYKFTIWKWSQKLSPWYRSCLGMFMSGTSDDYYYRVNIKNRNAIYIFTLMAPRFPSTIKWDESLHIYRRHNTGPRVRVLLCPTQSCGGVALFWLSPNCTAKSAVDGAVFFSPFSPIITNWPVYNLSDDSRNAFDFNGMCINWESDCVFGWLNYRQ